MAAAGSCALSSKARWDCRINKKSCRIVSPNWACVLLHLHTRLSASATCSLFKEQLSLMGAKATRLCTWRINKCIRERSGVLYHTISGVFPYRTTPGPHTQLDSLDIRRLLRTVRCNLRPNREPLLRLVHQRRSLTAPHMFKMRTFTCLKMKARCIINSLRLGRSWRR